VFCARLSIGVQLLFSCCGLVLARWIATSIVFSFRIGFHPTKGEAVFVSGASRGLGRAVAIHLAKLGYFVFGGVRNENDGINLKNECTGFHLIPVLLDISSDESVQKCVQKVLNDLDNRRLVALINNAAICYDGPIETSEMKQIQDIINVNVLGTIRMCRVFLPLLRQCSSSPSPFPRRGRILNVSSAPIYVADAFYFPYFFTKFALLSFSDTLRAEVTSTGVDVVCVLPGAYVTDLYHQVSSPDTLRKLMESKVGSLYSTRWKQQNSVFNFAKDLLSQSPQSFVHSVANIIAVPRRDLQTHYIVAKYFFEQLLPLYYHLVPARVRDNLLVWLSPLFSK